jgi:acyl carrier protein
MLLEGVPAAGPAGAAVVGCAVNQDGRSSSLTAPNGPSQQAVIRAAIADSAVPAEGVLGLQMHGTGTALGDPIEVSALSGVVLAGRGRSSPLALGAVKATSGHAEAAAGTAGVLQAAGSLAQRATALLPHVRELNPLVGNALASAGASLEGRAPAQVPLQEGPQVSTEPAGGACAVGVSSFAFQGSNAHALVAVTEAGSDSREESGAWRRRRCWFTAASPNRLVERALRAPRGGVALLQVQLGGASGAEVHFRSVRGRRAVSESALLEAASAGLRSLGPQAREAALAEVTLAPVLGAEAGVLGLRLDLECGAVEVGEGTLSAHLVALPALSRRPDPPKLRPTSMLALGRCTGFMASLDAPSHDDGRYVCAPQRLQALLSLSHLNGQDEADFFVVGVGCAVLGKSTLGERTSTFVGTGVYRLGGAFISGVRCSGAVLPAPAVVPPKQLRPAFGVQRQNKPENWTREDVRELISSLVESLAGFKIGPDSPFLESGLDSLSILSLSSQLSAALKRQVPAALISENPTIEQLSGALAMEARPALFLPLSSSSRVDFDAQIMEESRPHLSLKDPLSFLLLISSVLVVIFEFLRHILRVCFLFEIGSAETVYPERGEPLRWREVSELLPYDRLLRGYRMTHTLFFPYLVDEGKLSQSLASTLAAYPSFASVIVERKGRTFLDWGNSKGVPFSVQTRRAPMRRKDFIQGSFQYPSDVSLAPDRWDAIRIYQKVRDALLSPWELLGRPALSVSVVKILPKVKGRWAPARRDVDGLYRNPASPNAGSEGYPSSSYVTVAWSHALCDGPSMMAFLSHWAEACRGQKLEMFHPGPFDSLSQKEAERLRGIFESEVIGPEPSLKNSFVFRRCYFSRSRLEGYGMTLLGVQGSDVVASLLYLDLAKHFGVEVHLSFMQDMRLHLPKLRAYVGNFARLSEPRPAGGRTLEALAGEVATLRHSASGQWRLSATASEGLLPGRPCHLQGLEKYSAENGCVVLVVNDISQHEALFSFDPKHPAASTSEAAPSNFEAPGWEEFSSFDIPKDARNRVWTAILTRVSEGIQVTLLSL